MSISEFGPSGPDGRGVRLTIDPVAVRNMTQGEYGPVIRDLNRRADLLILAARRQIRVGHVVGGRAASRSTQHLGVNLRDTLRKRLVKDASGRVEIVVGSDHPIALIHHEGTRPHLIVPRKPDGLLVFQSARGIVFAKRVHHPGTRPNRYLTDNLRIMTR